MSESNPPARPASQITATSTSFEGPIPPPQVLQQYNNIVSNAAERILRMAEKQSDHRLDLEKRVVYSNVKKSYVGMGLAAVIALYGLHIAKEIAINGNPATAGIIATLDIGGLISIAIYNVRAQRTERKTRQETSAAPPARR
ncbi:MAG: DUF2335 domain-containing protein [Candidatus Omnitrophica bacterium]|nr:DUF2335 domain-containing protein [Candidatus Omnitrophota bacterium]